MIDFNSSSDADGLPSSAVRDVATRGHTLESRVAFKDQRGKGTSSTLITPLGLMLSSFKARKKGQSPPIQFFRRERAFPQESVKAASFFLRLIESERN
jgi:hypothetical protein